MSYEGDISANENLDEESDKGETSSTESLTAEEFLTQYESRNFKNLLPQILASVICALVHLLSGILWEFSYLFLREVGAFYLLEFPGVRILAIFFYILIPVCGILSGFFVDGRGRLSTIRLSLKWAAIGWIIIVLFSRFTTMIIIGIIMTGFAVVCGVCATFVYVTEIARSDVRGSLLCIGPMFFELGVLLTHSEENVMSWRTIAAVTIIYVAITIVLVGFIPESPSWLIAKGHNEEARKALDWFNKYQTQTKYQNKTFNQAQYEFLVKEQEKKESTRRKSPLAIVVGEILKPTGYTPLLILSVLFLFRHVAQVDTVSSALLYENSPYNTQCKVSFCIFSKIELVMSVASIVLLKIFRRRTLIIYGSGAMAVWTFIRGFSTFLIGQGVSISDTIPLKAIILNKITLQASLSPVPFAMTAEIFPLEVRGFAFCLIYALQVGFFYLNIALYVLNFPNFLDYVNNSTFIHCVFTLTALLSFGYAYFFLPETHGVKLKDIQKYFENGNYMWVQMKKSLKRKMKK